MPTPSGAISASAINYEIRAASNTTSLSLNSTNVRRLARVSTTSGTTISFNNLRNKSITNLTSSIAASDFVFSFGSPETAYCEFVYSNNGILTIIRNNSGNFNETDNWLLSQWQNNTTYAGQYEIRATQTGTSGTATRVGTLNSWLNLGTSRSWYITRTASTSTGLLTWTLTIDIREAASFNASTPIVATHTIEIGAEITS